jgi:hypothetical protein
LRKKRTRPKLALLATALLALALFQSRITHACGPFYPEIIFTNMLHPDFPVSLYASGNLGIVQPTYQDIYLHVAYRNLTGPPISPKEQTALWDNDQRLLAMSRAPDYLSTQVLAWAKAHPSDPRVREALALAVKSTRFGSADQKTGELSKAAFDPLHSRYPNSSWTDKTKYWFKM